MSSLELFLSGAVLLVGANLVPGPPARLEPMP
jgi:hypothetical protein